MHNMANDCERINYTVRRHFGTKSVTDLIANSMENLCKSSVYLTTPNGKPYNIIGSVEEVANENR